MTAPRPWPTPRTWAYAKLGTIADVQLGKMLDRKRTEGTPLRYVRNINVRWGSINTFDLLEMPFKSRELDRYSLRPGDVLVCEGGEPGRAAVWRDDDPTIKYQKAVHRVRMNGGILPRWLVFQLYFDAQRGALVKHFTGTTIKHLPREAIREYIVRVAPLGEQHRIVESIESYFTRLDDAVATLERVQRNLKRYRASVLKAAVEGRLVPTEAELARAEGRDYEPASVLLERILAERHRRWEDAELAKMKVRGKPSKDYKWKAKYTEPVGPDSEDLHELPEGWCWASVDQVAGHDASALTDGPFGSNLKSSHYTSSGPRVIRLQNIGDGEFLEAEAYISPEHFSKLCKHAVDAGDVVVASLGTELPRACVVPDWLGPAIVKADCLRFAVHQGILLPRYAVHVLNSPPSRKRAEALIHGVGRPRIGLTLLRQLPLPLPPLAEQVRIVAEVERALSLSRATTASAIQNTVRASTLRQSILKWAFEGRLVDQDPTDEPASRLLERIRAERDSQATQPSHTRRRARATEKDQL